MTEGKKTYKLQGKIASISSDFITGDITIYVPDGIEIRGVEQNAKPCGVENWRNVFSSKKFIIKEIFIPEDTLMENCRCFGDRMVVNAW